MADKEKHSGFEAPVYGELVPEGTRYKKNPDGTVTPIYPKKNTTKKTTGTAQKKKTTTK